MTTITYTILDGNLGDYGLDRDEITKFADAMETAIAKAYPDATVNVVVKWNTSGVGGGANIEEGDDDYVPTATRSRIQDHIQHIAEETIQQFGG